ncbi:MAG TPA: hypothetical protein VHO25_10440 [Polyangiaceae bacterium]|nr:hypothetical protein [Polyangiaceae bacterium]
MLFGYAGGAIAIGLRLLAEQAAPVPSAAAPEVSSPPAVVAETAPADAAPQEPPPASPPPNAVDARAPKTADAPTPKKSASVAEVMRETEGDQPFVEQDPKPASGWPYFIGGAAAALVGGVLLFPCAMDANDHTSIEDREDPCDNGRGILGLTALGASVTLCVLGFSQNSKRKAWKRRHQPPRVVPLIGHDALLLGYTGTF